jgi:hypothetical protein
MSIARASADSSPSSSLILASRERRPRCHRNGRCFPCTTASYLGRVAVSRPAAALVRQPPLSSSYGINHLSS